jgi:hypothetical protein
MNNRMRLLVGFVREAGLILVNHYQKPNKYCVDVQAENGAARTFWLSIKESDLRGDVNERAAIRRFARQNAIEVVVTEEVMATKKDVKAEGALDQLTPAEFYKLCEWTKAANWAGIANIEAAATLASTHVKQAVSETVLREAMAATETAEPEHWTVLPEPHVVVARELDSLMKLLGHERSRLFARMMELL